jgi:hypothetical protein
MNYNTLKDTAKSLLAKFGQSMTLVKNSAQSYNPTTGANTATAVSTTDIGVIMPYGDGVSSSPDSLIQQGDQQVFIQLSVVPAPTDRLTVGAVTYNVVSVSAIEPAGINVLYELQIRK